MKDWPMALDMSMKALQAFEAAARHGSFAEAARELGVTPAAVSQLVRGLEARIGRNLFLRANRGIQLTEAGRDVLPRLSSAFSEIQDVAGLMAGERRRPRIVLSVPPSVASRWLPTRIGGFLDDQGPTDISIRGEEDPVAFDRDGIDLRMTYGRHSYPGAGDEEIARDAVFPVCTPAFVKRHGPFGDTDTLVRAPLIHTDWGPAAAAFPTWKQWFDRFRAEDTRQPAPGLTANSSTASLELAAQGLGMALCQGMFAADFLRSGVLVQPLEQSLPLAQPYCLSMPQRSLGRPAVLAFKAWLLNECRSDMHYTDANFTALQY